MSFRNSIDLVISRCSIICIGTNTDIEKKYFLIEGTILSRQGITKVTSGVSRWKRDNKYFIKIHYGTFSQSYKFYYKTQRDSSYILEQILRCVNGIVYKQI